MADYKMDGNYLKDKHGNRIGEIDGKYIKDSHNSTIGTIDDVKRQIDGPGGMSLVALWLLLIR